MRCSSVSRRGDRRRRGRARLGASSALRPAVELLEARWAMSSVPFGAMPLDTGEFFLGSVTVNVVAMESDGTLDPSTEDWTPETIADVKDRVQGAMQWWSDTLDNLNSVHQLNFVYDWTWLDNPVVTRFEPINRTSNTFVDWVDDFLHASGYYETGDFTTDIRSFNNAQRIAHDTNWSFTIFVVNSTNDQDDSFNGGTFSRAFAFAGGQLFVTPSERPISTYAHETGHIFWALDEYAGGASYTRFRGYYNTQNLNAYGNPTPGFVQQPSIMANGNSLLEAFASETSSAPTLAMLGWQDSDGDGIFDVLDVPHQLNGVGYFDAETGIYHFAGDSNVTPLFNRNTEGLKNDITIARISRAEYRLDGGDWQTAASYDTYAATLNLAIGPLPEGEHTIEVRTIDDATGVTSPIFIGSTAGPSATTQPGVNGFVWDDTNANGLWDNGELPLEGWTVQLVDAANQPLVLQQSIEPDDFAQGTLLFGNTPGVTLTAIGTGVVSSNVSARDNSPSSTGSRVFKHLISTSGGNGWSESWTESTRMLKIQFASPVRQVSIDVIGNSDGDYGRLDLFDSQDNLIGRATTGALGEGHVQTLSVGHATADIAYAIARGHLGTGVVLDNLRIGPASSTASGSLGQYSLPYLSAADYHITVAPPDGWVGTTLTTQTVLLSGGEGETEGGTATGINFGFHAGIPDRPYQNTNPATTRFDVNNSGIVNLSDILEIAKFIRFQGAGSLLNPDGSLKYTPITNYVDVSGDNTVSLTDILHIASYIRFGDPGASGSSGDSSGGGAGGSSGEEGGSGEFSSTDHVFGQPGAWLAGDEEEAATGASQPQSTSSDDPLAGDFEGNDFPDVDGDLYVDQPLGDSHHHHHHDESDHHQEGEESSGADPFDALNRPFSIAGSAD